MGRGSGDREWGEEVGIGSGKEVGIGSGEGEWGERVGRGSEERESADREWG